MTQTQWILRELNRGRVLTAIDALNGCGSMKLATRISELKAEGHPIQTIMVNRGGKKFAKYKIVRSKK